MLIETLSNQSDLLPVARLYAQVFAGWPWFEVSLGPGCGEFRPDQPGLLCPCGCGILTPAYPPTETVAYIVKEITRPLAVALLAILDNRPVGFAWGFQMSGKQFTKDKYKKPASRPQVLRAVRDQTYFYISEVGVDPLSQGNGLGTQLSVSLAQQNPGRPLLMRTNQDSPMLTIATGRLAMTPVIASWLSATDPENVNRVILVKNL